MLASLLSAGATSATTTIPPDAIPPRVCLSKVNIPEAQRDHSYTKNGRFTRAAVFDDEPFGYVSRHNRYDEPGGRRLLCELDLATGAQLPYTSRFTLYDDGSHGDDVAGDGLYSNGCLAICEGKLAELGVTEEGVRYGSSSGGLGILSASLRGAIPRVALAADQLPVGVDAAVGTSHAVLLTASTGGAEEKNCRTCNDCDGCKLMPTYPKVGAWDHQWPSRCKGCKVAWDLAPGHTYELFTHFSAQFGGYFDGSGANFVRVHDATAGLGLDVGHKNGGFGNLDVSDDGIANQHHEVQGISWGGDPQAFVHETGHWAGISLGNAPLGCCGGGCSQQDVDDGVKYLQEDCAHLSGRCTVRSPQQGPMWDWAEWYPTSIPCDPDAGGRAPGVGCKNGVTLGVNYDDDGEFVSFRYDNVDEFNADGLGAATENGAMYLHDELMLYMYGLMTADEVRTNAKGGERRWFCMVAGPEWEDEPLGPSNGIEDGLEGRAGDRYAITGPHTSFTIDDMIEAFGEREPPAPYFSRYSKYERTASHGTLVWLDREYSEAEASWWTLYMRHHEDDDLTSFRPGFKGADKGVGWGGAGFSQPFLSWRASSRGRGTLRSRIDAIPCGTDAAFLPRSCLGQDEPIISWPPAPPPPPVCSYPGGDIPPGDACAARGATVVLPCMWVHATWPGMGSGGSSDMSGELVTGGGSWYKDKYKDLWSGGGVTFTITLGAWADDPTYRHAVDSIRLQSDWWNKRPKDITVNRWDADSGAWKKVRDFTYPGTSTKNVCGDGKTSFGGEECSCCGAGTHSHSFYSINLDGVATEKLQLVVTSSWWSGGFLLNSAAEHPIVVSGRQCTADEGASPSPPVCPSMGSCNENSPWLMGKGHKKQRKACKKIRKKADKICNKCRKKFTEKKHTKCSTRTAKAWRPDKCDCAKALERTDPIVSGVSTTTK